MALLQESENNDFGQAKRLRSIKVARLYETRPMAQSSAHPELVEACPELVEAGCAEHSRQRLRDGRPSFDKLRMSGQVVKLLPKIYLDNCGPVVLWSSFRKVFAR
jgi:hypothetical protein